MQFSRPFIIRFYMFEFPTMPQSALEEVLELVKSSGMHAGQFDTATSLEGSR